MLERRPKIKKKPPLRLGFRIKRSQASVWWHKQGELTVFFSSVTWLLSGLAYLLCYHSCQHLNVNIPNITSDIFSHFWARTADPLRALWRTEPLAMVDSWLLFPFFVFGCFSNMQNQANCLSVNIICEFSCTYTFYVLSDRVNRDSKKNTDACCCMISTHFTNEASLCSILAQHHMSTGPCPVPLVCTGWYETMRT